MRKTVSQLLITSLIMVCVSTMAKAQGNMHVGKLEIHPIVSVEQLSNDNIYTEQKDLRNGDNLTIYQLGLSLQKRKDPDNRLNFKAKYIADFIQYRKFDKEDRTDHSVTASAELKMGKRLVLKLDENFKKTATPPNSELTDLEKRLKNNSVATLGLYGKRMGIDITYQFSRDNYDTLNGLDKNEYVVSPSLIINLGTKTALIGEYNLGRIDYDKSTAQFNSKYKQWRIGLKGQILPKITGVIKVGHKETEYFETRTLTDRDFQGGTFSANLKYQMAKRCKINLSGSRSVVESTFGTNNFYRANKGAGSLEHQLTKRSVLFGGGSLEANKYPEVSTLGGLTDKRVDKITGATTGLRINLKDWLVIEGKYDFRKRDSNFNIVDYKNNIYSGKLSLLF